MSETVDLTTQLGKVLLPSPIIAASGTFGHGAEVAHLCDPTRLGAVTSKSQAPFLWAGNRAPRLIPVAAGMVNAVGLQGRGIEHWIERDLPELKATGARVIASIWGFTVEDFAQAARLLVAVQDQLVGVEINLSCPNHGSGATVFSHDTALSAEVVQAVHATNLQVPLFAKLSAGVTDLPEVAGAVVGAGATGLTLINTFRSLVIDAETRRPALGAAGGGLSGPALKVIALRAVHDVAQAHPHIPIIGTGGVLTGLDAVEMLLAGASAVGVGTATFYEPRATHRITDELVDWCRTHGVESVRDLIGGLKEPEK